MYLQGGKLPQRIFIGQPPRTRCCVGTLAEKDPRFPQDVCAAPLTQQI